MGKKKRGVGGNSTNGTDNDSESEGMVIKMDHDSMRPGWSAEDDGNSNEDFDKADAKDTEQWRRDELVREGISREISDTARSGLRSKILGDVEDERDSDYLNATQRKEKKRNEREKKDRPKMYATGPDISRKAERTQRRLAKSLKGQTNLDTYFSTRQASSRPAVIPPTTAFPGRNPIKTLYIPTTYSAHTMHILKKEDPRKGNGKREKALE
ncbi:hypothetical protein B0H34DRAFT_676661 [Crassisporium funariophilum]|nr:hypothetical protein B0H34DRAFT_676661 [Crassisporium funariophilum]